MNRNAKIILMVLLLAFLSGCAGYQRLNTGSYSANYIKLVSSNSAFLIHPTGEYPAETPVRRGDAKYEPVYRIIDNMERAVIDMQEKGYVMIGYAAVNTRERGEKPCDRKSMSVQEFNNCNMPYVFAGIDVNRDPLGNPVHAAIWANAAEVLVQKNYSFSRREVQQLRVVTDEGTDVTRTRGFADESHKDKWSSSTFGQSNTSGGSRTKGSFDQTGKEVHADVGYGLFGPTGNVGGSLSQSSGTNQSQTQYAENTRTQSRSGGKSSGGSAQDFGSTVRTSTKHWATALVEKNVDHYDYMVTFWKKADLNKVALGVLTESVSRSLWQTLGTRSARAVRAVIGGSPAYLAEIWEGDILVAINGEKIVGEQGFLKLITKYKGQEIKLTVFRNGQFYDVKIPLNRGV